MAAVAPTACFLDRDIEPDVVLVSVYGSQHGAHWAALCSRISYFRTLFQRHKDGETGNPFWTPPNPQAAARIFMEQEENRKNLMKQTTILSFGSAVDSDDGQSEFSYEARPRKAVTFIGSDDDAPVSPRSETTLKSPRSNKRSNLRSRSSSKSPTKASRKFIPQLVWIFVDGTPDTVELLLEWIYAYKLELPDAEIDQRRPVNNEITIESADYGGSLPPHWEVLRLAVTWQERTLYDCLVEWAFEQPLSSLASIHVFRLLGATFAFVDYDTACNVVKVLLEWEGKMDRDVVERMRQSQSDTLSLWGVRAVLAAFKQPHLSEDYCYGVDVYRDVREKYDAMIAEQKENGELEDSDDGKSEDKENDGENGSEPGGDDDEGENADEPQKKEVKRRKSSILNKREGGARGLMNIHRKRTQIEHEEFEEFAGLRDMAEEQRKRTERSELDGGSAGLGRKGVEKLWKYQVRVIPMASKPVFVEPPTPHKDLDHEAGEGAKYHLEDSDGNSMAISFNQVSINVMMKIIHDEKLSPDIVPLSIWKECYFLGDVLDIQPPMRRMEDSIFPWLIADMKLRELIELFVWTSEWGKSGRLGAKICSKFTKDMAAAGWGDHSLMKPVDTAASMALRLVFTLLSLADIPKEQSDVMPREFIDRCGRRLIIKDKATGVGVWTF